METVSQLVYLEDANGKEILMMEIQEGSEPYIGNNRIVMMEWEKSYMHELVDALNIVQNESIVLEIGWGCGYSANAIQNKKPKQHVIIECSPIVLERATQWAVNLPSVTIIEGYWQNIFTDSKRLKTFKFDRVFFDDFPLVIPNASDSVIEEVCSGVSRWQGFILGCLPLFKKEAKITGYMARPIEVHIPGVEIELEIHEYPVDVPSNCPYFPYSTACVPVFTLSSNLPLNESLKQRKKRKLQALVLEHLGL